MTANFKLASQASTGFSDASSYDKHRPSYPALAVEKLLTYIGIVGEENAKIVEVGAGTGKFTELLLRRAEQYEIIAIEPHDEMRAELVKKELEGNLKVVDGDAGHIPVEEGWGDVAIAAQAFHWFPTEESLKEIHRVLRPGAAFGMIWNVEDYNGAKEWETSSAWEQELKTIVSETEDGVPRFRNMLWKQVFEDQLDSTPLQTLKDTFSDNLPRFSLPLGEETIPWTVWLGEEAVWERFSTLSQIANLEEDIKRRVKKRVMEALGRQGVEKNEEGKVAVHGVTYLSWTSRV